MKNSIEAIWKEGFLHEKSLVAPKINDLYNQKSRHVVDRVIRMFKINFNVIVILAILFPIVYYFLDFFWQGVVASVVLLIYAWYYKKEMHGVRAIDQGATSLDYLKSFDKWLEDVLLRSEKIARFSYPLYYLVALSIMWSAWNKNEALASRIQQAYPDLTFIGTVPLVALIVAVAGFLMLYFFSDKIYKWELRLMYGRVFDKVEETIFEMEKLKQINMKNFVITSTSIKGNFQVLQDDETLLYAVQYKNWFSGEAKTSFDGNNYAIRASNFWQTQFDVLRNDVHIGKFSFNWKGEIIISYTHANGEENEMLFQYKGIWKFRFILSDRSGNELLAMVSSWSALKYHYDVSISDEHFPEAETKELLMICGYSANLYMTTMMGVF